MGRSECGSQETEAWIPSSYPGEVVVVVVGGGGRKGHGSCGDGGGGGHGSGGGGGEVRGLRSRDLATAITIER